MIWAVAGICVVGLLLGIRYRLPGIAIASVLLVAGFSGYGWVKDWTGAHIFGTVLGLLVVLQVSYLAGVLLSGGRSSPKGRQ